MDSPLVEKSKSLALQIVKACKELRDKREYILSDQLLRSGTSIGANIMESKYAISKADFVSKMHIALKECNETEYWLDLVNASGYTLKYGAGLVEECLEIKKMLISTCKTAKKGE